jgi:hypothetical protein
MEKNEEMDLKLKKQSEKIMAVILIACAIWFGVYMIKKNSVKVEPCECADLSSKAQLVGEWHLSKANQQKLIDCESTYTYVEEAYNECVDNELKKIH